MFLRSAYFFRLDMRSMQIRMNTYSLPWINMPFGESGDEPQSIDERKT
jgi:hypothetical protein